MKITTIIGSGTRYPITITPMSGIAQPACSINYVWETGNLFLKTREALEYNAAVEQCPKGICLELLVLPVA